MTLEPSGVSLAASRGSHSRGRVALCVASCGSGGGGGGGSALIRVFNAVVDGGPVTVTVGTQARGAALAIRRLDALPDGHRRLAGAQVVPAGGGSPIIDTTVVLNGGTSYSYVLFGTASTPVALLIQDGQAALATGQFGLRVTNAAIGSARAGRLRHGSRRLARRRVAQHQQRGCRQHVGVRRAGGRHCTRYGSRCTTASR